MVIYNEKGQAEQGLSFPTCGKELKKSLELSVVGHTFNHSIGKAEASRSLSLRPPWSIEQFISIGN